MFTFFIWQIWSRDHTTIVIIYIYISNIEIPYLSSSDLSRRLGVLSTTCFGYHPPHNWLQYFCYMRFRYSLTSDLSRAATCWCWVYPLSRTVSTLSFSLTGPSVRIPQATTSKSRHSRTAPWCGVTVCESPSFNKLCLMAYLKSKPVDQRTGTWIIRLLVYRLGPGNSIGDPSR